MSKREFPHAMVVAVSSGMTHISAVRCQGRAQLWSHGYLEVVSPLVIQQS